MYVKRNRIPNNIVKTVNKRMAIVGAILSSYPADSRKSD